MMKCPCASAATSIGAPPSFSSRLTQRTYALPIPLWYASTTVPARMELLAAALAPAGGKLGGGVGTSGSGFAPGNFAGAAPTPGLLALPLGFFLNSAQPVPVVHSKASNIMQETARM